MAKSNTINSIVNKILYPPSGYYRLLYHVIFWVLYVLVHFAYAIPVLLDKMSNPNVTLIGFIYFVKMIPQYYLYILIFKSLSKLVDGVILLFTFFGIIIFLNHLFSVGFFFLMDNTVGLSMMSPRFQLMSKMYQAPFDPSSLESWLFITYDISELELLILPFSLKLGKYGIKQSIDGQRRQNEALQTELKMLKSQINPHFIFNVINAAYAKVLPISEEAAEYLDKSAGVLRFSLYEANDEFIQLTKEIGFLRQYVELESVRSNHRCKINYFEKGEIKESFEIPTLLLITLVDNAFKHGVHSTKHNSFVDIQILIENSILEFTIVNSIPEKHIPKSSSTDSGGIGLVNLQKRLDIYYPQNHTFEKVEQDDEFNVRIKLPLIPLIPQNTSTSIIG